jgi:hypothetical protein
MVTLRSAIGAVPLSFGGLPQIIAIPPFTWIVWPVT